MEITLEMVDKVKERTGVSYLKAKEALEATNGDVLNAIIVIEEQGNELKSGYENIVNTESVEDVKVWLKDIVKKGYATRIRILKDETEICDVPVNAGVSAGVIAVCLPPVLAFALIAAVVTKITIEITRPDGSVEVVNKYISKAVNDVKDKASEALDMVKNKVGEVKTEVTSRTHYSGKVKKDEDQMFSYTVNFDKEQSNKK